jgi:Protein of unknown function (DUF3078)
MKKFALSLTLLFCASFLFAQDKAAPAEELGWKNGGAFGFDLSGLGVKNPRVGAGLNRFGIGGLGTYFANKKAANSSWDNGLSLQLGVLRIGGGDLPFQKNLDVLRFTSKYGRKVSSNGKWFASGLFIGTTSLLKTYEGNLMTNGGGARDLFSQFLSPAQIQFHPGLEWKPNSHFSLLFSPIGLNMIYVGDANLAGRNIHGNEFGKQSRVQAVPCINAAYNNKFLNDRVTYTSALNWTTDYLNNPFKQTAINFWQNNLSFAIAKGLSLDLLGELAYDHNKFIQIDGDKNGMLDIGKVNPIAKDGDIPTTTNSVLGRDRLGRGTQMVGSFLLKYSRAL